MEPEAEPPKFDQALFHGGGPKLGRIHYRLEELSQGRRTQNWDVIYWSLERLWLEVEAWLLQDEREEILPLWKKITHHVQQARKGIPVQELWGETLLLEIILRRVLKRTNMDMDLKPKEKHLRGAMI